MRVRLLGTAAGGGVPQWNCNCRVCVEARSASGRVNYRTQSSVAITADERHWFLLNASPDLRTQIESFPPLHPPASQTRGSPVQGVLLTNADLDHTLGILLMREGDELCVHATTAVRKSLEEGTGLAKTMGAFCGIDWAEPPSTLSPLLNRDGSASGLKYRSIPLNGRPPRFSKSSLNDAAHVVGYLFLDEKTGGRLLYLPDVSSVDQDLESHLADCDALLFDGTFWAQDEMHRSAAGKQLASEMGHMPITGAGGSLAFLKPLNVKHKIYVHINNTNPILIEGSVEQKAVLAAGCLVGEDGMELNL